MKHERLSYLKSILTPCLLFSALTGIATGGLIFLFRFFVSQITTLCNEAYQAVRANPKLLVFLLLGVSAVALLSAFLLRFEPNCRGGGIPTSVALMRGLIDFHWVKNIFILFTSACMTYLCGVPLGIEGPSVQMGTAVGRGSVDVLAKRHRAWDRYMMTGGACAGFAAATGAPLTGIFFAFEEAHRRFSPMLFMVSAVSVLFGTLTMKFLCAITGISSSLFDFSLQVTLPLRLIWSAVLVGVICGFAAVAFTKLYRACNSLLKKQLHKIPFAVKYVTVFFAVALIGFFAKDCIGSGHHLIEEMLSGQGLWYWLLLVLCLRALLLILANTVSVTGGIFVPSLAFGAVIGALCAKVLVAVGILDARYYAVLVVVGMASFLSASARTPITAVAFSLEAMSGLSNILPIVAGATFSYLVIEALGVASFNETVIESKVEHANAGKIAQIVDTYFTVQPDSFAVGKEIRDILWPPTCVILSVQKQTPTVEGQGLCEGDVLHMHYKTYDKRATANALEALVGKQEKTDVRTHTHREKKSHQVPEI